VEGDRYLAASSGADDELRVSHGGARAADGSESAGGVASVVGPKRAGGGACYKRRCWGWRSGESEGGGDGGGEVSGAPNDGGE